MLDVDARDYGTGGRFVKKQELRVNGPRQVVVVAVEEIEGFADRAGKKKADLLLVFTDKTKLPLRNETNRLSIIEVCGERTSGWIGQTIELLRSAGVQPERYGNPAAVLRCRGGLDCGGQPTGGGRHRVRCLDGVGRVHVARLRGRA